LSSPGRKKIAKLLIGLLLVAAGTAFILAPLGEGLTGRAWTLFLSSMMWLWPLFLVCMGVVRVMGFAVERKPRSPLGGTLLISIGILFIASRFHSDLNALRIYGRYWLVLLAIFAGVELLRYYSHRHSDGPPPRMFTPGRLIVIGLIVSTGVLSNRVAGSNPSLLSALRLPAFLSGLRDSVVGETYRFTDPAMAVNDVRPGTLITINNSFGDINVTAGTTLRATLNKGVRAWNEADARQIADQIRLVVSQTAEGITITTNRDDVNQQFTTDLQVDVPTSVSLRMVGSYGTITAGGTRGPLAIKASYSRALVSEVTGDLTCDLAYTDLTASNIHGDITATGVKHAKLSGISGSVDLSASNGSVDLREISGEVQVDAPFSRIVAQGLGENAKLATQRASVQVSRAADVVIVAPHSDVKAESISGDLQVSSSNGEIQLRAIAGGVTVSAERSSVNADEIRGPVDVETSHGSVVVKNFYEAIDVRTSYRTVTLISSRQPADDISVDNDHGEIKLVLPESSEFVLDASSQSGQVRPVGFNALVQKGRDTLAGVLGSDGPTIRLRTSFKNITIQASGPRQAVANGRVMEPQ
jgi:hypothetical protein